LNQDNVQHHILGHVHHHILNQEQELITNHNVVQRIRNQEQHINIKEQRLLNRGVQQRTQDLRLVVVTQLYINGHLNDNNEKGINTIRFR